MKNSANIPKRPKPPPPPPPPVPPSNISQCSTCGYRAPTPEYDHTCWLGVLAVIVILGGLATIAGMLIYRTVTTS